MNTTKAIAAFILLWAVVVMLGILAVDAANMRYSEAERIEIGIMRSKLANLYCEVE
jgi:hypothetical protein